MRYLAPVNEQNDKLNVVGIFRVCFALIACLFIFVNRANCQSTDAVDPVPSCANRDARVDPANGTYARAAINSGNSSLQIGPSKGTISGFAQYNLGGFNGLPGYRMFSDFGSGASMLMAKTEVRRRLLPKTDNKIMEAFATHVKGAVFADAGEIDNMNAYSTLMSRSSTGAAVGDGPWVRVPMLGTVRMPAKGPLPTGLKMLKGDEI